MNEQLVRSVIGKTYMLTQDEELWEKELPLKIEQFIQKESSIEKHVKIKDSATKSTTGRDKTKLVVYHLPANEAVQLYDYKLRKSRICFGPELVMLEPDEHFTDINLSGSYFVSLFLLLFLSLVLVYHKALNYKKYFLSIFCVYIFYVTLRRFLF